MSRKIKSIIGIILSIIVLVYFENFIYRIINVIGLDLNSYSYLVQSLLNISIKIIMCSIIYIIYKKDFSKKDSGNSIFKNVLYLIVYLIVITIVMYLFNYCISFLGDIFNIEIIERSFYNIFNKTFNIDLIIKILSDYVITPYLYCSIILLSVDKFCDKTNSCIILSGLLAGFIHALTLSGTLGFVILNSLNNFLLFGILAHINRKRNSIVLTIVLYAFYLLSNVIIINYLRW